MVYALENPEDHHREIQILPNGVYFVSYHKLNMQVIKAHRTKAYRKVLNLHRRQVELRERFLEDIRRIEAELRESEAILAVLNGDAFKQYLANLEREKEVANEKAQQFLHEFIGDNLYNTLQKEGSITFQAKDGQSYTIDREGILKPFGSQRSICLIKPQNLPLPDFIVSAITSMKENPDAYQHLRLLRRR